MSAGRVRSQQKPSFYRDHVIRSRVGRPSGGRRFDPDRRPAPSQHAERKLVYNTARFSWRKITHHPSMRETVDDEGNQKKDTRYPVVYHIYYHFYADDRQLPLYFPFYLIGNRPCAVGCSLLHEGASQAEVAGIELPFCSLYLCGTRDRLLSESRQVGHPNNYMQNQLNGSGIAGFRA